MATNNAIKNFEITNGLGKISFSGELITSIIKNVLFSYPDYEYISYEIDKVIHDYFSATINLKNKGKINLREIDRIQKDLLIVFKQSLSLNCVVIINFKNV